MTQTPMTTCAIVDDEAVARYGLRSYVCKTPGLICLAEFKNIAELEHYLQNNIAPDIIFMDINMPEISGLDFIASNTLESAIVIVTAYEEYALKGFELNVCDYLLKPPSFTRFLQAVDKAGQYLGYKRGEQREDVIFVRADRMLKRIRVSSISYLESLENYVRIHTDTEKIVTRITLKELASSLPAQQFAQIHKSYIINILRISSAESDNVLLDIGEKLPVSRNFRKQIKQIIHDRLL
ncbi:MAG: response regulator transcription factor [Bacteroidales bacterium]|nr:response regulator transcription factor [Bacteroidales bacterium]